MQIKNLKNLLKSLVLEMEKTVPYASAFAGSVKGRNIQITTYEKSVSFKTPSKGVTFTAFTGDYFIEKSTNKLNKEEITKCANDLIKECESQGINENSKYNPNPGEKIEKDFEIQMKVDPYSISLDDIIEKAGLKSKELFAKNDKIVNAAVIYAHEHIDELFVNRNKVLFQTINRWQSIYYCILNADGRNLPVYAGDCKMGGYEFVDMADEKFDEVLEDGYKLLKADRIKPGMYDCIFSPELSGMFAHEAFGHGTETDMFLKKRAKGQDFLGKKVAADKVNMYDNPAYEGIAGSFFFDNEGQLAENTQIIKDGVLVSGLTDMNSAMRLDFDRTPNGRRESYSHKAYARMTNTYFEEGNDKLEEMIKDIDHGYIVDYPTNGMEDPKGWGIQLEAMYAREIKNGKLTENYYSPIIVTGYVPDLLNSITMIGDKIKIAGLGMCGKGHKEWVKVTDGGPYLRLKARLA